MAAPKRKNGNEISVFFNMSLHQFMESNFFFFENARLLWKSDSLPRMRSVCTQTFFEKANMIKIRCM